jgi:hypothetical protein
MKDIADAGGQGPIRGLVAHRVRVRPCPWSSRNPVVEFPKCFGISAIDKR